MIHPIHPTVKQSITVLILATVAATLYFATAQTPIEKLKENFVALYVNKDSSVQDNHLLIMKILKQAKDADKCARAFNEVIKPAHKMLTDGTVRTESAIRGGIEIMIVAIELGCK
jgi:hypothetical protein